LIILFEFIIRNPYYENFFVRTIYFFIDSFLAAFWIGTLVFVNIYLGNTQLFISIKKKEKAYIIKHVLKKSYWFGGFYFFAKFLSSVAYYGDSTEMAINRDVVFYWIFRNAFLGMYMYQAFISSFQKGIIMDTPDIV
jgi:hypothetical protein